MGGLLAHHERLIGLAADVGGTKVLLRLFAPSTQGEPAVIFKQRLESALFASLPELVNHFIAAALTASSFSATIAFACFGLPGPVQGRQALLTNLPWKVSASELETACQIDHVCLVNDFYAAAKGVASLKTADYVSLLVGQADSDSALSGLPNGNRLVIGAGTGLGVAPVLFDGQGYYPQPSEGGHFEFAPISTTQQVLLQWLWQYWSHVSYERLLSGSGLSLLYQFFQSSGLETTYTLAAQAQSGGIVGEQVMVALQEHFQPWSEVKAEQIVQRADQGDAMAQRALMEFATIYGAFAGAAALLWPAPGGVFLAGGIAAKIQAWMGQPYFQHAFLAKGRMHKQVKHLSVYIVLDAELGLKGAQQLGIEHHLANKW